MSSSNKRRHSKWDNKDSEPLPETLYDRAQPRRPREPYSPGRASRRHDIRIKESALTLDREGNCPRISPELDEWRSRHSSRSPRNGWGRSHRISGSRSRSRSQSPVHNFRREPTGNDRSRSRSGASAPICRDFAAGRCRRGNSCHFLHQDHQLYDSRRSLECSPPDDWENRRRRTGSSRYSPDDIKDNVARTDKSALICNDYLKGRCRRGDSCRFVHQDTTADVFEKGPVEDVFRNRDQEHKSRDTYPDHGRRSRDLFPDQDRRSRDPCPDHDRRSRDPYPDLDQRRRDTYPDRNHESEPPRKGETPCKFFAAGNCRNGTRCRFSHQVQEAFSPERRPRDNRRDPGRKYEGGHGWDGPRWSDATTIPVPAMQGWEEDKTENKEVDTMRIQGDGRGPDLKYESDQVWDGPSWTDATTVPIVTGVHGWEEDKNEIPEVANDATKARPEDDSWGHDMLNVKPTWETTACIDKSQIHDKEEPLQWKTENNVPGMIHSASRGIEIFSGDMEISPRDIKQQGINPSISQTPSLSNITFPAVQQGCAGEASYGKHYPTVFQEHRVFNDPFAVRNPSFKDIEPILYSGDHRDVTGDHDGSDIIQNPLINVPLGQSFFQPDKSANVHPISNINPPPGQSPLPVISVPPRGETMQMSHNPPSFLDNKVAEGSHVVSLSSTSLAPVSSTSHSTVSNEQLAQLSHLTASLTQLLENRQQLSQLSSAVSNLPNLAAPDPPVSGAMIQPNQVPEVLKQYDPVCNSIDPKRPNLGNQLLPSVEQKNSEDELHEDANNKIHDESHNVNQQDHLASTKDEENGKETLEGGIKAPENGPSQDVGADDLAHNDSKKLKDTKVIRPFKFALAEFVKELLKPSWKDGQVSKEAYKTIVKKVVDKVMETLGPQIPQTKEKIDLYLSCSKQKIDKLVQAYVGKHQKS